jgi:hypothetical protein
MSSPLGAIPLRPALLGVLALIAVIHLPLLGFQFVYDDGWTIVTNGFLRVPSDLPVLLSREAVTRHVPDAFRPGLVAFDVLTYQLFGLSSALHHALSIALHLGVCAALARWLRTLGAPADLVLGTVSLFGLLAVHAEATAVVSFREDLLAALLGLLAADAASRRRLARAALLSLGACSMKLSAGAVPLAWLLAESLAPWRPRLPARARLAGFVALCPIFSSSSRRSACRRSTSTAARRSPTPPSWPPGQPSSPSSRTACGALAGARSPRWRSSARRCSRCRPATCSRCRTCGPTASPTCRPRSPASASPRCCSPPVAGSRAMSPRPAARRR